MNESSPFLRQLQQKIEQYLQDYLDVNYILEHSLPSEQKLHWQTYRLALVEMLELIQKLVFLPGKRWRPILAFLHALLPQKLETEDFHNSHLDKEKLIASVVVLVELLHNATLIADDIEDNGKLRRGIPALHLSYGLDRALNACNWAYFLSTALLNPLKKAGYGNLSLQLQERTTQCLNHIHLGQALDIRWHREQNIPTAEEYFCMAHLKTGALAGFAAESGILLARCYVNLKDLPPILPNFENSCRSLWQRVGRAFQVLDDLQNITTGNPGKLRGDDWLEGKKSLPVCFFVHGVTQSQNSMSQDFISGGSGGLQKQKEERQEYIASLMQQVKNNSVATELERVSDEFIHVGSSALWESIIWLEQELADCRKTVQQLYSPFRDTFLFQNSSCYFELLFLLNQLEKNTQHCRNFLAEKSSSSPL